MTERGKPFSAAGFTNWFRDRCIEADLKGLSAHGIRKEAATRAAEGGGTSSELMALFGWRTVSKQSATHARPTAEAAARASHCSEQTVRKFLDFGFAKRSVGRKTAEKVSDFDGRF